MPDLLDHLEGYEPDLGAKTRVRFVPVEERLCIACAHPLRSIHLPLSAAPGTRAHAAHGLCTTCYKRRRTGATPKAALPKTCALCDRPMRSSRIASAAAPGTVPHAGRGICHGCRSRQQGGKSGPVHVSVGIDEIAVDLAIHGEPVHLNPEEKAAVVRYLTARSWSAAQIAVVVSANRRTVQRYRSAQRAQEAA